MIPVPAQHPWLAPGAAPARGVPYGGRSGGQAGDGIPRGGLVGSLVGGVADPGPIAGPTLPLLVLLLRNPCGIIHLDMDRVHSGWNRREDEWFLYGHRVHGSIVIPILSLSSPNECSLWTN